MAIEFKKPEVEHVGSWQQTFTRTCSERIQKAIKRAIQRPEICLERARAEVKAYQKYKDEPHIIQRAQAFATYLLERNIAIREGELIVGSVTSKHRASPIFPECCATFLDRELDDPEKDFSVRRFDTHVIHPEERKELREVIIPFWKGKTIEDYMYSIADAEVKEKSWPMTASCPHIPVVADVSVQKDAGHQMPNYEKVLYKGLNGIKKEAEAYLAELEQPYIHYETQKKRDFYKACIISLDAAIAHAKRYADLARKMAIEETNPVRKAELKRIAEVCDHVPANPARDWWEAVQSVWFVQMFLFCEFYNVAASFGRYDQYMYPFYKKSVIDDKTMTRDEALELLECFWVKDAEFTMLVSDAVCRVQTGYPIGQNLLLGGQTRDGKDSCNEVTMLCMEAEEQVGLFQPDIAFRIWEGTPQEYLKKAAQIVRLGRGKMKFYSDRKAVQMLAKAYPALPIEDLRDYAVYGCVEVNIPHITMQHSFTGISNGAKILELVLSNGRCTCCGKQIGPLTGDPRTFESMSAVREAFRTQLAYWMKHMARGVRVECKGQADRMMAPFASSLLEGPLQKGIDLSQGGAWYTTFGLWLDGPVDVGDSLGVIDKLIYKEKKVTWDELLAAIQADWRGHEELRQLCINDVPKYGNDIDTADEYVSWVMDIWYDQVDWLNTQKDLLPEYGGMYTGCPQVATMSLAGGMSVGALPNGHLAGKPLADTVAPGQGLDRKGPSAVIKSVSKLPSNRFAMGVGLNQKLSPQLLATDRDVDNFVAFLRTIEELGVYHIQFNVITSDLLRKAMKEPENYKDLMVRVAAYCSYFVELPEEIQLDIIARTEQKTW